MRAPHFAALQVVENRLGPKHPYEETISGMNPLYEAIIRFPDDTRERYDEKKQWLQTSFGLVSADPTADAIGPLQAAAGALDDILVYEDPAVTGMHKGAWRVHCNPGREAPKDYSSFYFRLWERGNPDVLGKDTMTDAVRKFMEQFNVETLYQFGSNYQLRVDFDRFCALSPYPVQIYDV